MGIAYDVDWDRAIGAAGAGLLSADAGGTPLGSLGASLLYYSGYGEEVEEPTSLFDSIPWWAWLGGIVVLGGGVAVLARKR